MTNNERLLVSTRQGHSVIHNSLCMNLPHMAEPLKKNPDALKTKPERLDAGFAVTFPGEEAAEHGDSADHITQLVHCFRDGFLGQDVCVFPLL